MNRREIYTTFLRWARKLRQKDIIKMNLLWTGCESAKLIQLPKHPF